MDKQHSHSLRSSFLGSTPHPTSPIADEGASPRFSSFSRRFRSPPPTAAQIAAALDPGPAQARNAEAVKSTKRYLFSTIRDDWEYEPTAPQTEPDIVSSPHLKDVEYIRREEGSSDPGSGPEDHRDPMVWTDGESNPYKYESPDAIAAAISQKKRKRRRLLKEEMQYNEGLRVFHERRNAWTGAVSRRPRLRTEDRLQHPSKDGHSRNGSLHMQFDFELERSKGASPFTTSRPSSRISDTSIDHDATDNTDNESRPDSQDCEVDIDPLLPVAPPLLPNNNPLRAAITPSMYPTIYSKVVVQSLTPSVPIPLPDITRAMVQGWKEEGNWPPRANGASAVPGSDIKNSKALRGGDEANVHGKEARAERRDHLSVRKGMSGALRKALGLRSSGQHHHHQALQTNHKNSGHENAGAGVGGVRAHGGSDMDSKMTNLDDADAMFEAG